MDVALRSARYDARLLSNHLKRALGKGNELVPESAARAAANSLLAQGDTRGNADTEKALRLSRLAPPPPSSAAARSTPQDSAGTAMDVEGDGETDATVGGVGVENPPPTPPTQLDSTRAASPQEVVDLGDAENESEAAGNKILKGGHEPASANSVVDQRRLIAILEAEERISAMAKHLGSADPMTGLRSILLPEQPASASWFSRSASAAVSGRHPSQFRDMGSPVMVLRESSAADDARADATSAVTLRGEKGTKEFPQLGDEPQSSRGNETPALRKQRRSRSVEDSLLSSTMESWEDCPAGTSGTRVVQGGAGSLSVAVGLSNHGRKKRSRESEAADEFEELARLGRAGPFLDRRSRSELARSISFTSDQRQGMTAPEAGVTGSSSYCSLPQLKTSTLNRSGAEGFFFLEKAGSSPGLSPLVSVSSPVVFNLWTFSVPVSTTHLLTHPRRPPPPRRLSYLFFFRTQPPYCVGRLRSVRRPRYANRASTKLSFRRRRRFQESDRRAAPAVGNNRGICCSDDRRLCAPNWRGVPNVSTGRCALKGETHTVFSPLCPRNMIDAFATR